MYKRLIFKKGVPDASFFLFGPRQTGKTTFIESIPTSLHYNLLRSADFLRLNKDPDILFMECSSLNHEKKHVVWIDEVQKIPQLLDAVHNTLEKFKNINFILSGSSARKLRKYGINLLGGRALDYKFHPLVIHELKGSFDLSTALAYGTLPKIYSLTQDGKSDLAEEYLNSYVSVYLEEEIRQESLVRSLQPFQRFLEVAGQCSATIVNISKVADDSQISFNAATNYFSILEDTLIGFFLPAYHASIRKQLVKQPKFYLFDNGVNRAILNSIGLPLNGLEKGRMFEQYIVQEVRRINDYFRKNFKLYFWRTEAGAEVDLLVCKGDKILLAIECKASGTVNKRDLSGLKSFKKDYPKVKTVVCAPVEREMEIEEGFSCMKIENLMELIVSL